MTPVLFRGPSLALTAIFATFALRVIVPFESAAYDEPPKTARYYREQAAAAYKNKDYAAALVNLHKALELIPDHPSLFYNIAAISALQGKASESVSALTKIADMGIALRPEKDREFDAIKETPEFKAVLNRFDQNRTPLVKSTTAFTIHEKGLITEGLAYDPIDQTFFVSSVHKRKILSIGRSNEVSTLATEQDGLFSVLGMKVDPKRRYLWVPARHFHRWLISIKTRTVRPQSLSSIFERRNS